MIVALLLAILLAGGSRYDSLSASPGSSGAQDAIAASAHTAFKLIPVSVDNGWARRIGSLRTYRVDALPSGFAFVQTFRPIGALERREAPSVGELLKTDPLRLRAPPQHTSTPA